MLMVVESKRESFNTRRAILHLQARKFRVSVISFSIHQSFIKVSEDAVITLCNYCAEHRSDVLCSPIDIADYEDTSLCI